jgi:uncharacterized protein
MKKIVLIASLLYCSYAAADFSERGVEAYEKGELQTAMVFWNQGCEKNQFLSCDKLGMMYYFGYGTQKDQLKALHLYEKACHAGMIEDCYKIAKMYDYGYGVSVNKSKALKLYQKGCKDKVEDSCKRCEEISKTQE